MRGNEVGWNGVVRFLGAVTAVALAGAAVGGVVLTLRGGPVPNDRVEFAVGRITGTVLLESADDPGPGPFTDPVAVDLDLDPLLIPLPPLNAGAIDSPHRRGSEADLLAAGDFGRRLVQVDRSGAALTVGIVRGVARDTLAPDGVVADLVDGDGDGYDDDGRVSLVAADGSAACVRLPVERSLAAASGAAGDGPVPVSGYWWSPYGPCGSPESVRTGSDVRVGTTPGVYAASASGEVCDVAALRVGLASDPGLDQAWAEIQGIERSATDGFLDALTGVVLLHDTAVTDHLLADGRITARVAVLQRGTAVMVDETGVPRVRCISGSPLRPPSPIPSGVVVEGAAWPGFSLEKAQALPAAVRATDEFVLVDIVTGAALHRSTGVTGALTRLAGPLYPPASG